MADPRQEVHEQVKGAVEGHVKELAGKGNRFDLERAAELGRELDDMNAALKKVEAAVAALKVRKPEDADRARGLFKQEIVEALTALRNTLQGHERDALFLVQGTRHELESLGALAAGGPPIKERAFGLIKSEQIDEWLAAIDRDPQNTLNAMIGVTRESADEIATGVPTEGARRDGTQIVANRGTNVLARYLSGGATEKRLQGIEQER